MTTVKNYTVHFLVINKSNIHTLLSWPIARGQKKQFVKNVILFEQRYGQSK